LTFAVVATISKDWASNEQLSDALVNPAVICTIHRSPFWKCTVGTVYNNKTQLYNEECTRFPIFGAGKTSCEISQGGNEHLCQQVHLAGNLLVASCVLLGVALLLSLLLCGISVSSRSKGSATPMWTGWLNLSNIVGLLTGGLTLALAQLLGVDALANWQRFNGDWIVSGSDPTSYRPWIIGKAPIVYASTGWLAAVLSIGASGLVWRIPRVVEDQQASGAGLVNGNDKAGALEKGNISGEGRTQLNMTED